jgi:hypothetical protein
MLIVKLEHANPFYEDFTAVGRQLDRPKVNLEVFSSAPVAKVALTRATHPHTPTL